MADLETVVRRIADVVLFQVRRLSGVVTKLAAAAIAIAVVSFALGAAALDGGVRTVWIVLAVVFGWFSISRVVRLRWNLAKLTRNRIALESELHQALDQQPDSERIVVQMNQGEMSDEVAMEVWTNRFAAGQFDATARPGDYRWLSLAVTSLKQLGVAFVTTTFITIVFAAMALLFLLGLALS